jgi:hypothetical protein
VGFWGCWLLGLLVVDGRMEGAWWWKEMIVLIDGAIMFERWN